MPRISESMFLECYEAWRAGNRNHVPDGMNANSASMTMLWLDSLFTGRPYHRDGSAMQYRVILERIRDIMGQSKLISPAMSCLNIVNGRSRSMESQCIRIAEF